MVGQRQPVLPQLDRGQDHLVDRRPAVAPVRMAVQVTDDSGIHRLAACDECALVLLLQRLQVCRQLASAGLGHYRGRRRPQPGQLRERPGGGASAHLTGRHTAHNVRRSAEGLHPEGAGTRALEEQTNATQRLGRSAAGLQRRHTKHRLTAGAPQTRDRPGDRPRRRRSWRPGRRGRRRASARRHLRGRSRYARPRSPRWRRVRSRRS